jgi:hypothetical protein
MHRVLRLFAPAVLVSLAASMAHAAGPYYARGSYYAGTAGTWGYEAATQLWDDGLHGDGAAGDNVYGVDVVSDQPAGAYEFKISNADWTENWPKHPVYLAENARLITTSPGETIHFRLDLRTLTGWQPVWGAVACDHAMPAGTQLELIGSAPELGSWTTPVPTVNDNGVWTTVVHIATPGSYQFKYRGAGSWVWPFGIHYNMGAGDNFTLTTTIPGSAVRFWFNTTDGRGYAQEFDDTPARVTTWGRIKSMFR